MMQSTIMIPRPFAVGIDDMGWKKGSNDSRKSPSGPYRAGVKRIFDLNDYRYVIDVAKAVGVRIQGLFVLGDFDKENVLEKYSGIIPAFNRWRCRNREDERELEEIMEFLVGESAWLEFGFHGIDHEYWEEGGTQKRAEWYNLVDRKPWPEESLRKHISAAQEILAQYGLSPEKGHSFPESFVPCAYSYYWNPGGDYSLGRLLHEAGVKFACTDFSQIPELSPPMEINGGEFDHGVHVVSRMNYGNTWYELDSLPRVLLELQGTDMIESHWPNWLAQDDFLQPQVTGRWIQYYRNVEQQSDRYLAKNTEQFHSQWLYRRYTRLQEAEPGTVVIDNTWMPQEAYSCGLPGNLVLKLQRRQGEHIAHARLDGKKLPVISEGENFVLLYLPPLERRIYKLEYTLGPEVMPVHIYHSGTFNVYQVTEKASEISISLKIYGTQILRIACPPVTRIHSHSPGLKVLRHMYDRATGIQSVELEASNFQGIKGEISLHFS